VGIIWTIIIGFIAGVIAKLVTPRTNEPSGFILTYPGYLGQALGWYRPGEGAGPIGAIVGAVIVLLIWGGGRQIFLGEFTGTEVMPPHEKGRSK
jgi:uncharacterized membrane protein YeaQ/YmgE (transglycosylase-associated protein family)